MCLFFKYTLNIYYLLGFVVLVCFWVLFCFLNFRVSYVNRSDSLSWKHSSLSSELSTSVVGLTAQCTGNEMSSLPFDSGPYLHCQAMQKQLQRPPGGHSVLCVFILPIRGQLHSTLVYGFLQDRWVLSWLRVPFTHKVGIHAESETFTFSHVCVCP